MAALLPGLWHIVYWTPRGIGVGLVALAAQFILTVLMIDGIEKRDEWWVDWSGDIRLLFVGRIVVHLITAVIYFSCASRWRIEHLERRGYKCTQGVRARTRDEAIGKLPTHLQ